MSHLLPSMGPLLARPRPPSIPATQTARIDVPSWQHGARQPADSRNARLLRVQPRKSNSATCPWNRYIIDMRRDQHRGITWQPPGYCPTEHILVLVLVTQRPLLISRPCIDDSHSSWSHEPVSARKMRQETTSVMIPSIACRINPESWHGGERGSS